MHGQSFKRGALNCPSSKPVFTAQPINASEFAEVASDELEAKAARVTGDEQVIWAKYLAACAQFSLDFGRVESGLRIKVHDTEPCNKIIDLFMMKRTAI